MKQVRYHTGPPPLAPSRPNERTERPAPSLPSSQPTALTLKGTIPAPPLTSYLDDDESLRPRAPSQNKLEELKTKLGEQKRTIEALEQRVRDLEELEEQRAIRRTQGALRPLILATCRVTTSPSQISSTSSSSSLPPQPPTISETTPPLPLPPPFEVISKLDGTTSQSPPPLVVSQLDAERTPASPPSPTPLTISKLDVGRLSPSQPADEQRNETAPLL
jgi:hypothetical protein